MATVNKFEDLLVWQKARILSKTIYKVLSSTELSKDFRMRDRMRGSVGSIMDNIAEGFDRGSRLEFLNALSIAKGETGELKSKLYKSLDVGYLSNEAFEKLYCDVDEVAKMLASFIEYLNKTEIRGVKFKDRI
jgi:four helix bundle protein